MRICDAAKHASVDLSPAICSLAALAPVRIKYSLRGDCVMFLSIILHIKDKEKVIIWTEALDSISCEKKHIPVCIDKMSRMCINSVSVWGSNAKRKKCTDAFTLCLTFSVAASILDHCLSAPLRLTRWQVC